MFQVQFVGNRGNYSLTLSKHDLLFIVQKKKNEILFISRAEIHDI